MEIHEKSWRMENMHLRYQCFIHQWMIQRWVIHLRFSEEYGRRIGCERYDHEKFIRSYIVLKIRSLAKRKRSKRRFDFKYQQNYLIMRYTFNEKIIYFSRSLNRKDCCIWKHQNDRILSTGRPFLGYSDD